MSDVIQLLPDSVANQIATAGASDTATSFCHQGAGGECLYAGARNIQVVVVDAGRTNIQVIDDGKGDVVDGCPPCL